MPDRRFTVVLDVQPFGARKVAQVAPYSDGGFALLAPYLPGRDWSLIEFPTDYTRSGRFLISTDHGLHRRFRSKSGVKLSVHGGGFVQFSRAGSSGILSGRDPKSGAARAFGYESFAPGRNWIRTGPYCAVMAWGLDEWTAVTTATARRSEVRITEEDLYYQGPNLTPEEPAAFAFEFWVIPRRALFESRRRGAHRTAEMPPHPFYGATDAVELILLDLEHFAYVIGLVVMRTSVDFESESGLYLSAPSNRALTHAMMAFSPAPPGDTTPMGDYGAGVERLPAADIVAEPLFVPHDGLVRPWGRRRG